MCDFRKLNLGGTCTIKYNNNHIKENNCLIQRINLLNRQKIYYVFEFPDKILFCGAYSKIFRIKLTNNDLRHNIIGIIKLGNLEHPKQLISLEDSLLVALTEQNTNCNIKIFIKVNDENSTEEDKSSDILTNPSFDINDILPDKVKDKDKDMMNFDEYNDVAPP